MRYMAFIVLTQISRRDGTFKLIYKHLHDNKAGSRCNQTSFGLREAVRTNGWCGPAWNNPRLWKYIFNKRCSDQSSAKSITWKTHIFIRFLKKRRLNEFHHPNCTHEKMRSWRRLLTHKEQAVRQKPTNDRLDFQLSSILWCQPYICVQPSFGAKLCMVQTKIFFMVFFLVVVY